MADAFFAHPETSVRGWERAVDAQARIVSAMRAVLAAAPPGDVAVVSHGGVGALLLSHLQGAPISRTTDQPEGSGGHVLAFDREDWTLRHGWRLIDNLSRSAGRGRGALAPRVRVIGSAGSGFGRQRLR